MDVFLGGGTCIHGTITFSGSIGLILGVAGILSMDGSLFYRFNGIWETEVEGSIQSSQRFYIK